LDPMVQGLAVGATGLGITFAALGLVILVIVVLRRLFAHPRTELPHGETETPGVVELPEVPRDEAIVAAISAALGYVRAAESARGGLGSSMGTESGAWWHIGQALQYTRGDASATDLARPPSWREAP
jgi:Na+-transporting methylmalonyl-CoA/oxaloacetate decarboxylase gamma subunit